MINEFDNGKLKLQFSSHKFVKKFESCSLSLQIPNIIPINNDIVFLDEETDFPKEYFLNLKNKFKKLIVTRTI